MKVLFEFSRRGLPQNREFCTLIRDEILRHGHSLTNDLLKDTLNLKGELPEGIYARLSSAISRADCVVIEGSVVSLGLGYVLTQALNLDKPVLFLSRDTRLSPHNRFAWSIHNKLLTSKNYQNMDELKKVLRDFFDDNRFAKTRFNLVLPNRMNRHITVASKRQRTTKTGYILRLIEKDIKEYADQSAEHEA